MSSSLPRACSRSNHTDNAKPVNGRISKCLKISSQVNEKIHPKNDAAQYLTNKDQLMNGVEILAYVRTIAGTSL
jgi:hypothetical protein